MHIDDNTTVQLVEGESAQSNFIVIMDETDGSEIVITREMWGQFKSAVIYFESFMT